jgi:hypothetical protein
VDFRGSGDAEIIDFGFAGASPPAFPASRAWSGARLTPLATGADIYLDFVINVKK